MNACECVKAETSQSELSSHTKLANFLKRTRRINMKYMKQTTYFTVSVSLLLMKLENIIAGSLGDEKFELRGPKYPLELVPLIDDLNIEAAFTRRNYMKFLLKCVFFEGPCDFVGKWLKPRTLEALHGKCLVCTKYQEENMERWLLTLIHYNEDLFRLAMVKVCVDMDVAVPEDEKIRIKPLLNRKDLKRIYSVEKL